MAKTPKHILVVRLSAMGDVAMTIPVIRALVNQNPEINLTVLTRKSFSPFFKDIPNVAVHIADVTDRHKGVLGLFRLAKELKQLQIDAVADLHNVLRSKILKLLLSGINFVQIDKGRSEKKALITGKIFKQLKTTHQRYADVFQKLGITVDLSNPLYPEPRTLTEKTRDITGEKKLKWIGIAPFAQHESKIYPIEQLKSVIQELVKRHRIFLFGGGNQEMRKLEELQKMEDNVINVSGKISLDEELDLISNLDLMVSMDSGNAHLAAMLGKKVVTLWGVTHPYAGFYPFGQDMRYALFADRNNYPRIPTSVYGNKYPEGYRDAISSIPDESIVKKIESLL
ncbi:MAG: lipopolysaccharide heptosyltransferase family protein [Flavobacteriaceae bacterium]|nr:glycosyltransferase family 9 protein [Bacteroidia bacterium]NND10443.1 glycosyltransferase family 9 protein [Flavobacteriaceae bacterium]NNK27403.1 glycosyltransferase family 9 protein [Flavobacteriaceae bacterium]NNL60000.1 glycosyltransferase family 9 protein [Flavobacteriaceae bacterium]RZV56471.1 MAG: lipopolysaccharide heptosyltransferase family protein [Flavobacteriaceae bacterium]